MNHNLHRALQAAQWACDSILDAEFGLTHMVGSKHDMLAPVWKARERLMAALDDLSRYEHEIRASGARPTGSKPDEAPPNRVNGLVGWDDSEGAI